MRAVYDHFLVEMTQDQLDSDKKRIEDELKEVKSRQEKNKRIITTLNNKDANESRENLVIEHMVQSRILTVHSAGNDCEYVKPGDKVVVRGNSVPELSVIGDKAYFSYPEKAISVYIGQ